MLDWGMQKAPQKAERERHSPLHKAASRLQRGTGRVDSALKETKAPQISLVSNIY